ncbi:MAG: PAS domain S-box protein [Verrucomicrobia bacterium]|nr:PAS domain S-box protein [Verrucomicrobiota bacterium]
MRRLRDHSLKRKLTLITLLSSGAALVLACVSFLTAEMIVLRGIMRSDLTQLANVTGRNAQAALRFDDAKDAADTLAALAGNNQIVAACLYDKRGQPFAQFVSPNRPGPFTPPAVQRADARFSWQSLTVFQSIEQDGEVIGTIYLEQNLWKIYFRVKVYSRVALGVLLVSSLLALLLSTRLQRVITHPIAHLLTTARTVADEQNYSVRAERQSEDELGRLTEGFNHMLAQVEARDVALQEANDRLEERVQERTRALQSEIAERQKAEAVVRASEEKTRAIIESALDAVITVSERGAVTAWNSQAEATFGWSRQEALGKTLA